MLGVCKVGVLRYDEIYYTPCCVDTNVHLALNKTLVALDGL